MGRKVEVTASGKGELDERASMVILCIPHNSRRFCDSAYTPCNFYRQCNLLNLYTPFLRRRKVLQPS